MNKWVSAFGWVLFLLIIALILSALFVNSGNSISDNSIAIVPLYGVITSQVGSPTFLNPSTGISSTYIIKKIDELNKDENVKGIIFEIDSPGGEVVASQEIADAVKKLNKPNYAVIRSTGASGGYWIASATDKIFASPMSITGSIGVIGSYLEFSGLMEKYGIDYERFVTGKYKDMGSPFKDVPEDERNLLQNKMNKIHDYFVEQVSINRNLELSKVNKLATGEFYLGSEAKELQLIDEFGNREVAVEFMKKELNLEDANVIEIQREVSLFELIGGFGAYHFGKGFANELIKFELENKFKINV